MSCKVCFSGQFTKVANFGTSFCKNKNTKLEPNFVAQKVAEKAANFVVHFFPEDYFLTLGVPKSHQQKSPCRGCGRHTASFLKFFGPNFVAVRSAPTNMLWGTFGKFWEGKKVAFQQLLRPTFVCL